MELYDEESFERVQSLQEEEQKREEAKGQLSPYKIIARDALMSWNGMSEEEATKVVRESTNEQLESQVYAEGSIDYALKEMQKFAQTNFPRMFGEEPETQLISDERLQQLKQAVMDGPADADIFGIVKGSLHIRVSGAFDSRENKDVTNEFILDVLSSVHDGWVKDNQKKFFARDKKYQHMPIELIGWDEAKSDLLFVGPILSAMGIKYDMKELETAYDDRVKDFFKNRGIREIDDLQGKIVRGASFYPALEGQDDVIHALQDPQFVSESVIPSIKAKGVGADKSAMSRIDRWKERGSKLRTARARKQELEQEAQTIGEAERLIDEKENETKNID